MSIVVIAALTAWGAEPASRAGSRAPAAGRSSDASNPVELLPIPGADESAAPSRPSARPPRARSSMPAVSSTTARRRVPVAERGTEAGTITQTGFQQDLIPTPDSGPGQVARPFRKIADIIPYDNYEPDRELAGKDPCANLCPRPGGPDCPDCDKDNSGNGLSCPECPWEQELRRIGRAPGEPDRPFEHRNFAHIHYCWEPTNLYHNPIYFEDVHLERYGHTRHYMIQPIFSVTKFAVQFVGLPYQMSINPVWDKQYSLGYYRPGEYVPYKYCQIPLNLKAAIMEAGVITGAYFLFAPGVGP